MSLPFLMKFSAPSRNSCLIESGTSLESIPWIHPLTLLLKSSFIASRFASLSFSFKSLSCAT